MRNIRIRDTWMYHILTGIVVSLSVGFLFFQSVSISHWLIFFFLSIVDSFILESTQDVYRASRMKVLVMWFFRSLVYFILFYFLFPVLIKNNFSRNISIYFYFFSVTSLAKLLFLSWTAHRLKKNTVTYNTAFIGEQDRTNPIVNSKNFPGQNLLGSIGYEKIGQLVHLGTYQNLESILNEYNIEEVIITVGNEVPSILNEILTTLRSKFQNIMIRITPDSYDYLLGYIKLDALYGTPLIELPSGKMSLVQRGIKRILDTAMALFLLILLLPMIIWIYIKTKLSTKGSVIYTQERIGYQGKPFYIFKFRSMHENAETDTPLLSYDGDIRCTPWGAFMRKWRLDEIPQFINVIKGDMSIVGPRPERKYFIDQIKKQAPFYPRILTVLPGITSWGQVKFGYASNTSQMVERLKFDLIYVENQSLLLDIKIILYTILVLFQGKGK